MELKAKARETLDILHQGGYKSGRGWVEIGPGVIGAVSRTELVEPGQLNALLLTPELATSLEGKEEGDVTLPVVSVTDESSQVAAKRLWERGQVDLLLLNFASARNPGGGFLTGAKAQEEDLSRCSALYPCLTSVTAAQYYKRNRESRSYLYTDHMIWSPKVPFFRVEDRGGCVDEVFFPSVVTVPAPNANAYRVHYLAGGVGRSGEGGIASADADIELALRHRAGLILALAESKGHRNLLLGAWGCGVFGNNPALVADSFATWLERPRFKNSFDAVTFAILDRYGGTRTAFERRFGFKAMG